MNPDIEPSDLYDLFLIWRHEGIMPLSVIKGYAEMLLEGSVGDLTQEQRSSLEVLRRKSIEGIQYWHTLELYLRLRYGPQKIVWQSAFLQHIIERSLSDLRQIGFLKHREQVQVDLPASLPLVKVNGAIEQAIVHLIVPSFKRRDGKDYRPSITAQQISPEFVQVEILSGLQFEPEIKSGEIDKSLLAYPGSDLSVAYLIFQQYGTPLEFEQIRLENEQPSQAVKFRFTLFVWDDTRDSREYARHFQ